MAGFDYDVLIIGSGFGGSVAALRAAEKGYRVAVMEAGPRWPDEKIPKSQWDLSHLAWKLVAVALLALPVSRKLARRRERQVVARAVGP